MPDHAALMPRRRPLHPATAVAAPGRPLHPATAVAAPSRPLHPATTPAAPSRPLHPATAPAAPSRPRRAAVALVAATAMATLAACSSSRTGHLAVALDPAGRLLAVLALCDGQVLSSLTLTDETTGTSTTVHPAESPPFGGSIILTAPIADPRPEGALDLLDRAHDYTLSGTTRQSDSDDQSGTLGPLRFKLDTVVKSKSLRTGNVLTLDIDDDTTTAELPKPTFTTQSHDECD